MNTYKSVKCESGNLESESKSKSKSNPFTTNPKPNPTGLSQDSNPESNPPLNPNPNPAQKALNPDLDSHLTDTNTIKGLMKL